jgi:hypothetical protein
MTLEPAPGMTLEPAGDDTGARERWVDVNGCWYKWLVTPMIHESPRAAPQVVGPRPAPGMTLEPAPG